MNRWLRAGARSLAVTLGIAAAGYATYVGITWWGYGDVAAPDGDGADPLLDRFMPAYEIAERHYVRVAAPAAVTLDAARHVDLQAAPVVRTIIRAREVILGATPGDNPVPVGRGRPSGRPGLLAEVQSLGWGVLAEVPGREVVVGAVTR